MKIVTLLTTRDDSRIQEAYRSPQRDKHRSHEYYVLEKAEPEKEGKTVGRFCHLDKVCHCCERHAGAEWKTPFEGPLSHVTRVGPGVLPYMSYIGMCAP